MPARRHPAERRLGPPSLSRRDLLRRGAAITAGLVAPTCAEVPIVPTLAIPRVPPQSDIPGGLAAGGPRVYKNGKPFFLGGINHWSAATMAREGDAAGWDQLRRDLDAFQSAGMNTVRLMAASEGPDDQPLRLVPSLQPAAGRFDPAAVAGLHRLIAEFERRGLHAILTLNNHWPWSGGFSQYLDWAGMGPIRNPPPYPDGSWYEFESFIGGFFESAIATSAFEDLLRFLVPQLKNSPAVIWELCNEAHPGRRPLARYRKWLAATAALVKSLAPAQLLTTGSMGGPPPYASVFFDGVSLVHDHEGPNIDFATFHLWPQDWQWLTLGRSAHDFPRALEEAKRHVTNQIVVASRINKPILLEAFDFPRDGASCVPGSPTTERDRFFEEIYDTCQSLMGATSLAGVLPWAWAGPRKPPRPGESWRRGDPFLGDPPPYPQGRSSIYTADDTWKIIAKRTARIVGFTPPSAG
jgi:mannan endo-1,4-beta-mannosidase